MKMKEFGHLGGVGGCPWRPLRSANEFPLTIVSAGTCLVSGEVTFNNLKPPLYLFGCAPLLSLHGEIFDPKQ